MEVELDPSLLSARPREDLALLGICVFGLLERHRIIPDARSRWEEWASMLPLPLKEEVLLAWDESERRAAEGGPSERVRVVPTWGAQFGQVPIRVTPMEALGLLGQPLRVLLENGRNDRAFVLAFADTATQKALLYAEKAGWLVFETAGGIQEILIRSQDAARAAPREVFRTMYLCDSDALEPGKPSKVAHDIEQALIKLGALYRRPHVHFGRVLARRAAENYAPPDQVLVWARDSFGPDAGQLIHEAKDLQGRATRISDTGDRNSKRRLLLAAVALTEVPDAVCGHLDMKEGRERSGAPPASKVVRTADSIWGQLDPFQQAALLDGFGSTFSSSFYEGKTGLRDVTGEVGGLIATIMERV